MADEDIESESDFAQIHPEMKRMIFRRVLAYRDLCRSVRNSSTGSLFFGGLMLFLWYASGLKFSMYGMVFLGLALLEFCTGMLNRLYPSAEGVLLEGFVLLAFGGWNLIREGLKWQAGGRVGYIGLFFGVWMIYRGVQLCRTYLSLRKLFADRPSFEHLRWVENLIREIRYSDPETDPLALRITTKPYLQARLLGDTAFFLFPDDNLELAAREDVLIEIEPGEDVDKPRGYLTLHGHTFPPFRLTRENWENYSRWKAEELNDLPEARPIEGD